MASKETPTHEHAQAQEIRQPQGGTSTSAQQGAQKPTLPKEFKPNEPKTKSGVDKDGNPDGTLSQDQVNRAATEAMIACRPQPTVEQMDAVYSQLDKVGPDGQPEHKFKTAKEAGDVAVALLQK